MYFCYLWGILPLKEKLPQGLVRSFKFSRLCLFLLLKNIINIRNDYKDFSLLYKLYNWIKIYRENNGFFFSIFYVNTYRKSRTQGIKNNKSNVCQKYALIIVNNSRLTKRQTYWLCRQVLLMVRKKTSKAIGRKECIYEYLLVYWEGCQL